MLPAARAIGPHFGQANLPQRKLARDYRLPSVRPPISPDSARFTVQILALPDTGVATKTVDPIRQSKKWLDQFSRCIYDQFAPTVRCRSGCGFDSRRTKPRTRPPAASRIGDSLAGILNTARAAPRSFGTPAFWSCPPRSRSGRTSDVCPVRACIDVRTGKRPGCRCARSLVTA